MVERTTEIGDGALPHGVVTESDDIVVNLTIAQLLVLVSGDIPVAGLFRMDNNL